MQKGLTMFSSFVIRCAVLAITIFGAAIPAVASQKKIYTLAVIPSVPPVTLHKQWVPFVERLSLETGLEFRLKMYEKMAEFERDIWSGIPDFIFSSPIQIVVAHKAKGYVPLVRSGKAIAVGLFVRKDSPVKSIDDLSDKTISFVGNKNLCSVFIQHQLGQHKDKLAYTREYAGSTRNVIINVLMGKSDAGAVLIPALAKESEDTHRQLREIMETPEIASHPLSAHPRVPRAAREAVKRAVVRIAATRDVTELLKTIMLEAPVTADYGRDYQSLEEIDIKGLTNWGQ